MNYKQSIKYRKKVHHLIPGGAHTYSKGDDQFPTLSPAAIAYGKGTYVWDLDGNKYLDCSLGLTSVCLGHAYEPVDNKVIKALKKGVNFQRPSYMEMEIAEKFLSLIPIHDMIKFAKNGSTLTTASIKLARAYTGRKYVAFPSDSSFHSYDDWFIGKKQCNKGIPDEFINLSLNFDSSDLDTLQKLFDLYPKQIACVISEPEQYKNFNSDYFKTLIKIAHDNGSLCIADEIITGFKVDFPGYITKHDLYPDMATWGKGIANGYSFCALTGKKEIMDLGGIINANQEKVFLISTTHGGETTGIAACLATINEFEKNNVIEHNHQIGHKIIDSVNNILKKIDLDDYISVSSNNWWPVFNFKNNKDESCLGMKTLMMQEMIKRSVLFNGYFVPCFSQSSNDIDFFINSFEDCLSVYADGLNDGYQKFLHGAIIKPVFRKYI